MGVFHSVEQFVTLVSTFVIDLSAPVLLYRGPSENWIYKRIGLRCPVLLDRTSMLILTISQWRIAE